MNDISISVIIPSKNDEEIFLTNLNQIQTYLKKQQWKYEIILVSNGSSKENNLLIDSKKEINFKHLKLEESGKGLAIKHGIKNAIGDYILFMDADCSVAINELDKFIDKNQLIDEVVIGTRRTKDSLNLHTPFVRRLSGAIYISLVKFLFKLNVTDTQCGFKLFKRKDYLMLENIRFNNFSFDIELLVNFNNANLNIKEVPVDYIHNLDSKVMVIQDSLSMFFDLIKLKLRN
tara:strand:+ start:2608 stop:3303 length:696 start_codon:yes stop_codon:yes gene_type:complete